MENHQRGIFEYKCRRCGEIYLSNYETLDRVAEMLTNVRLLALTANILMVFLFRRDRISSIMREWQTTEGEIDE